jgi:hypothetical protein
LTTLKSTTKHKRLIVLLKDSNRCACHGFKPLDDSPNVVGDVVSFSI